MNDSIFTLEKLLTDETFLAWFHRSDSRHVRYWTTWISQHPEHQATVDEAVQFLQQLETKEDFVSEGHTMAARERLMAAVHATKEPARIVTMSRRPLRWIAAASVIGLIALSIFYYMSVSKISYTTEFAETRTVVLPDGSQVTLNANSSLQLKTDWKPGAPREVWLEGEGFFSVKHTVENAKFIVHTNDLNVEVLGTEFNLQHRRQKTTVVLHSGKVRLTEVHKRTTKPLLMLPGDLVQYNKSEHKITRKIVETEEYTGWKEGKMIFNNADFNEIVQVLEENYGLKVNIGKTDLKGKEFNGVFPTNNLQVLLTALAKAYDIDIKLTDKEIKFHQK